jgi:hypothetical protein
MRIEKLTDKGGLNWRRVDKPHPQDPGTVAFPQKAQHGGEYGRLHRSTSSFGGVQLLQSSYEEHMDVLSNRTILFLFDNIIAYSVCRPLHLAVCTCCDLSTKNTWMCSATGKLLANMIASSVALWIWRCALAAILLR